MWKLSTVDKKSCTQIEYWTKDGLTAQREIGWRWCWATYKEKPDLGNYDSMKDQVELHGIGDVYDMEQTDGCWEEWTWPDEIDIDEAARLEEIYNEDWDEGLEAEGWTLDDTEYWVSGELSLEEVENDYFGD